MSRKSAIIFVTVLLFLLVVSPVSAQTKAVLGSQASPFTMAPTSEGPGLINPDGLLYPLDLLKQQVRLAMAITPAQKAYVYGQIANERFAEFRVEILQNNRSAAYIALNGLRDSSFQAGQQLTKAIDAGQNVKELARNINNDMKRHQDAFDDLAPQASGELKAELTIAQATLIDAKKAIEGGLSQDELANAVQDDLARDAARFATDTADAAKGLKTSLELLQKQAKEAADANQKKREEAINEAIKQKNAELKKVEETKLAAQIKQTDLVRALQAQAAAQAEQVITKAQEVATTVQTSQKVTNGSIPTDVVLGASTSKTLTPTPTTVSEK